MTPRSQLAEVELWFSMMRARVPMREERLRSLGFADFRLMIEVTTDQGPVRFGIILDGYDVVITSALSFADELAPEAVLSGPFDAFREMVANILGNGEADLTHTLNALSLAEVPLRLEATDPIGRDKFFRFAQTLQVVFDSMGVPDPVPG